MTLTYLLAALVVVGGASVSGAFGFGFGIVTMPFLIMLFPAKMAVGLNAFIGACGLVMQIYRLRRFIHLKLATLLCSAALLGMPLGAYVLVIIDPVWLKMLIGLAVLVAAAVALTRRSVEDLPSRLPHPGIALAAGAGAGVLSTSVGQPGIPLAFLMAWTRLDKAVVRATLATFFLFSNTATALILWRAGLFTGPMAVTAAQLVPFYLLGLICGEQIFRRSSQSAFQRALYLILGIPAAVGVANGLQALLLQ